ncbi:MAG: hypothetical protein N2513_08225 [Deltaproteobacteria bacterium]|nr:hypothetical protein [Deltaproteobacteria bacterium]
MDESEKPILTPEALVCALTHRHQKELSLKKRAIITIDRLSLKFLREKTGAKLNKFWDPYRIIYEIPRKNTILTRSIPSGPMLAALVEEISRFGSEEIIFFGLCGSIMDDLNIGEVIIAKGAIRDEGTSFQYLKNDYPIVLSNWFEYWAPIVEKKGFIPGTVWTTDGLYRETKKKVEKFTSKGACGVEMEVASFYAVCKYLNVKGIAFLLVSDMFRNGQWIPGFDSTEFKVGSEKILNFLAEESVL